MRRIIEKVNSSIAGTQEQVDTAAAERADIDQNLEKQEVIERNQKTQVEKLEGTISKLKEDLNQIKQKQLNKFRIDDF